MRTEHIELGSETAVEVLQELGQYAVGRGYATEGYVEAILNRETDFPTGLPVPTAPFDVAIPHADPEYVRENALVLGLPDDPVRFRDMDDPDDTVEARVVMLLLARDSEGYTAFLANLANLFQHPEFEDAVRDDDPDRVLDLVSAECL